MSKHTEYRTPRVNSNINHGLQVIMCQCSVSWVQNLTMLVSDGDGGAPCNCGGGMGGGLTWEISVPSSQVEEKPKPKSAPKKIIKSF